MIKSLLNIGGGICISILSGIILSKMWGWFIVSVFHLPALSVLNAIGVIIVVQFLTLKQKLNDLEKDMKEKEPWNKYSDSAVHIFGNIARAFVYGMAFLTAYVWHLFM